MKHFFAFFLICISAYKSFSAFDTYATLYKSKITLNSGKQITGYYYHFNYNTSPKYSFTNNEFHEFLKSASKNTGDSIEIYTKLQNIQIPPIHNYDSNRFSAVSNTEVHKIAVNNIKKIEFISGCDCQKSIIDCTIIKELNQNEINIFLLGKAKLLYRFGAPDNNNYSEAGYMHLIFGNEGIISKVEIEKLISSLYIKNSDTYKFNAQKYYQLKNELRKRGIILITLLETDYFTSNELPKD